MFTAEIPWGQRQEPRSAIAPGSRPVKNRTRLTALRWGDRQWVPSNGGTQRHQGVWTQTMRKRDGLYLGACQGGKGTKVLSTSSDCDLCNCRHAAALPSVPGWPQPRKSLHTPDKRKQKLTKRPWQCPLSVLRSFMSTCCRKECQEPFSNCHYQ